MNQGTIRVVNLRGDMAPEGSQPEPDESCVRVDRVNPVLGNPHRMKSRTREERARVIAAYRRDMAASWRTRGAMYQAVAALAERVQSGESLCLQCWCKPLPCHADVIQQAVQALLDGQDRF